MQNRNRIGVLVGSAAILAVVASGCKNDEESRQQVKEETQATAPASSPTAATSNLFNAQITIPKPPQTIGAGQTVKVPVKVKNLSAGAWAADPKITPRLSYHWSDKSGKLVIWDGTRSYLPKGLAPNEELLLLSQITAPDTKGDYVLELDMVSDAKDGGWFGRKGSQTTKLDVTVN